MNREHLTHKDIGDSLSCNHGGMRYNYPARTNNDLLVVCPRTTELGSELAIAKLRFAITAFLILDGSAIKFTSRGRVANDEELHGLSRRIQCVPLVLEL